MKRALALSVGLAVGLAAAAGCGGAEKKPGEGALAGASPVAARLAAKPSAQRIRTRVVSEAGTRPVISEARKAIIDRHVLAAPADLRRDPDTLAQYLVEVAENDFEKAWAIYRWIGANIAYDIGGDPFSESSAEARAERTLERGMARCDGYSSLMRQLGQSVGIEARPVRGYAKGHTYVQGKRYTGADHEWIAIRIDGKWHLADPTWGAGVIENGRFKGHFDDTFFLTPPEYFIFDHLPEDSRWQFLDPPLTLAEYEAQRYPGRMELRCFQYLGFSGLDLLESIRMPGSPGLARAHEYPDRAERVRVEAAPLESRLRTGAPYRFTLEAAGAAAVAFLNEGQWVDLMRIGQDRYSGEIRPGPGELKVSVAFSDNPDRFFPILIYGVD